MANYVNGKLVVSIPPKEWLEEATRALSYDPETGVITWLESRAQRKAGSEAGCTTPKGYRVIGMRNRNARVHQLAWFFMTGEWPTHEIDHKNGVRTDNRWENLRKASPAQNHYNRHKVQGTSRYLGVHAVRKGALLRWVAHQRPAGYLGYFFSEEAAARAYDRAALARDPEFARTNFPASDYAVAA